MSDKQENIITVNVNAGGGGGGSKWPHPLVFFVRIGLVLLALRGLAWLLGV